MKGSHKCGRIEHSIVAGQTAADIDRVRELKKKLELIYVELEPGIFASDKQDLARSKLLKLYQQFQYYCFFCLPLLCIVRYSLLNLSHHGVWPWVISFSLEWMVVRYIFWGSIETSEKSSCNKPDIRYLNTSFEKV